MTHQLGTSCAATTMLAPSAGASMASSPACRAITSHPHGLVICKAPAVIRRQRAPSLRGETTTDACSTSSRAPGCTEALRRLGRRRHAQPARQDTTAGDCSTSSNRDCGQGLHASGMTRRQVLQASAVTVPVLWAPFATAQPSAAATGSATTGSAAALDSAKSPPATDFELFRGKGGFTLRRPTNAGWVTAFVRSLR